MIDTIIAAKAKEQHDNFLGKVFTHFSKPKARFVREATYGIQASGDTKLSSIVRVKSRSVLSWYGLHEIGFLAESCTMRHHHHVTFDSHGKECNIQISFGTMPVRLPMFPDRQLHLVVVKGFGQQPMMLLTSLPVDASFKSQWRIVEGYLSRWRIEETIRFIK